MKCATCGTLPRGGAIIADDMTSAGNALVAFYDALANLWAGSITRAVNGNRIDFAEVSRGAAGAADDTVSTLLATQPFTISAPAADTQDLPAECAVALSFNGVLTGLQEELPGGLVRPKSRRRGRVFLGPWIVGMSNREAVTNRAKVSAANMVRIVDAYTGPFTAAIDGPGRIVNHVVYSPTTALTHAVVGLHCDDAFDTIRSRGEKSVVREERTVSQPPLVP